MFRVLKDEDILCWNSRFFPKQVLEFPQNAFLNKFLGAVCTSVGSSEQLWVTTSSVTSLFCICTSYNLKYICFMFSDKCKKNKPWKILCLGDAEERMKTIPVIKLSIFRNLNMIIRFSIMWSLLKFVLFVFSFYAWI